MLFSHSKKQRIEAGDKRVILLIGGGGVLGKALLDKKPDGAFVINLTKKSIFRKKDVINCHFDVSHDAERAMRHIASLVDSVDVLINAAVIYHDINIERLNEEEFTEAFVLNTFVPIKLSRLVVQYFWSACSPETNVLRARKVINISSTGAFGNDARPTSVVYNGTKPALYSGTKAALNIMTEYLHEYVKNFGTSAHIIAPHSLKRDEVIFETVKSIWELQSKRTNLFTMKKIW